ncbi:WecB/TagA/CpsF family glycosyltransferase [Flavivirga algicola]|uniref:WecB/TagA/CpsF family glycosyltransferase n=1 Tax=Flavivirga algicola TaxID=2729136 RepID=A0ABX1RX72_9FLAO|nr:WecB/TagA/CpsF family glycosyltransferase [Flavivirga algicola]NMH87638.1 WecB/TagA/CpsF family glycosyltransferase [Flavivirga algicola]
MHLHYEVYSYSYSDAVFVIIAFFILTVVIDILLFVIGHQLYRKQVDKNHKNINSWSITYIKGLDLKNIIRNHIFSSNLSEIDFNKRCIISTINPHSYCVSKKDPLFQKALMNSDVLLPDGSGIVLASKILFKKKIKKIAGADIHAHLLKHADINNKKVFYLGASEKTLGLITKKLKNEYPNIQVSSYSPPYKPEFSGEDTKRMIDRVNEFNPDILFVGMTAPKQEKWVETNKKELNPTVVVSIGAVFDFYAGTVKRSSPFWINLGLEWLPRLIKEPKRLWRRNFISTPLFLFSLSKAKLNLN